MSKNSGIRFRARRLVRQTKQTMVEQVDEKFSEKNA